MEITDISPEELAERDTAGNPRYHVCGYCNWVWQAGQHGGHDCLPRVVAQRNALLKETEFIVGRVDESLSHFNADNKPRTTKQYEDLIKSLAWDCLRVKRAIAATPKPPNAQ